MGRRHIKEASGRKKELAATATREERRGDKIKEDDKSSKEQRKD